MTAFCLAAVLVMSMLGEGLLNIVDWFTAYAASDKDYYAAELTLFDYYTDSEIKGGVDDNDNDWSKSAGGHADNCNEIFNSALVDAGYAHKAEDATHTFAGHDLKYFPLYLGLQYSNQDYTKKIRNDASYNYSLLANSAAGATTNCATIGLVDTTLHNGRLTQGNGATVFPFFDEEFLTTPLEQLLFDSSILEYDLEDYRDRTLGRVGKGYKFRFLKDDEDYYVYDSELQGLNYLNKVFTVDESGQRFMDMGSSRADRDSTAKPGFFPWLYIDPAPQNMGYAAQFTIPFTMSSDGSLVERDDDGSITTGATPIKFEFRGDDDVWVFIDDVMVLDIGGAHGAVSGSIDFKNRSAKTDYVNIHSGSAGMYTSSVSVAAEGSEHDLSDVFDELGLYSDSTQQHKLTVYYIERGTVESNCYIRFNFQIADSLVVENKLDTSRVNPFFERQTREAAAHEGVQYVMASNSERSVLDSPDAGKPSNLDFAPGYSMCTVSYNVGGNYGSYASDRVRNGTDLVLPPGYKLYRQGYTLKGWSLNPDGSGELYTTYRIEHPMTFYAVWERLPMDDVPPPLLFYINAYGSTIVKAFNGSSGANFEDYMSYLKHVENNSYLLNFTRYAEVNNGEVYKFNFYIDTDVEYDSRHPCYSKNYNFTDNTGEDVRKVNGDPDYSNGQNFKLLSGGCYVYTTTTRWYGTMDKYTDYTAVCDDLTLIPNGNAATFVERYFALYRELTAAREKLENELDNDALLNVYIPVLQFYKSLEYSPSLLREMENRINALNDANNSYRHNYSYSDETVRIYAYSESDISGTVVSVAHGYDIPDSCPLPTLEFAFEKLEGVPEGCTDSAENYYYVDVPRYIYDERETLSTGVTVSLTYSTELSFRLSGRNVRVYTGDVATSDYPCYYSNKQTWKDIIIPWPVYSDNMIVWFYGDPGSVEYCAEGGMYSNTVTAHEDVDGFYYAELPTTIDYYKNGAMTQESVEIKFDPGGDLVDTTMAEVLDKCVSTPCYFNTSAGRGWFKLVTVCVDIGSCNYLHTWDVDTTRNNHPRSNGAWANRIEMTENISGSNYYSYMPYCEDFGIIVRNSGGSIQSRDMNIKNFDALYGEYDSSVTDRYKVLTTITPIAEDSIFYEYTVGRKAVTLLSSYDPGLQTSAIAEPEGDIPEEQPNIEDDTPSEEQPGIDDGTPSEETAEADQSSSEPNAAPSSGSGVSAAGGRKAVSPVIKITEGELKEGQFAGDGTQYIYVNDTNFKLYDPYFSESTGGKENFVIRSTDGSGRFNLMFEQTAYFTYQFNRFTKLKLSQTGSSYKFSESDIQKGQTVGESGEQISSASDDALYTRYSTSWVLTDEEDGVIASSRDNYSVYPTSGDDFTADSDRANVLVGLADDGSVYFDNLDKAADGKTGIHLTATFTNTVLVGELNITKELTEETIEAIREYQATVDPDFDPEFAFQISFGSVFGGDSEDEVYYYKGEADGVKVGVYYVNGVEATDFTTVNGVEHCIVVKYSDLYDENGVKKDHVISIKDIPVDTRFSVKEVITNYGGFVYEFKLHSVHQTVLGQRTRLTVDSSNTVSGTITAESDTDSAAESTWGQMQTSPLTQYYSVDEGSSSFAVRFLNGSDNSYLVITKTVDEYYYGANDDPAGLLGTAAVMGGATASADDPNGYEAATNAEQTFIYRIKEYENADTSGTPLRVFYETISFARGTALTKSRVIAVDHDCYYTVEEISPWSWKYSLDSVSVTDSGVNGNGVTSDVATAHNFKTEAEVNGTEYRFTDIVTFTGSKKTDGTEDIEGDTAIAVNSVAG